MKRLGLLSIGVLLAACSKHEPPPEPVRPVLSIKVQALNEETLGRFAGSIQARYESNTGFRVGGRIASRNVDVGAEVQRARCSPLSTRPISRTSCVRPRAIWPRSRHN